MEIGDKNDEVGIAHVGGGMAFTGKSFRDRLGDGRTCTDRTHRDADGCESVIGIVVDDEFAQPCVGADDIHGLVIVAGHRKGLAETADAVPTHLGPASVCIPQVHHDIDRFTVGVDLTGNRQGSDDEPVGTDATTTITQGPRHCGVAVKRSVDLLERNDEVIPESVMFRESHSPQSPSSSVIEASAISVFAPSVGIHPIRGSRPNQRNWRRANRLVRATAFVFATSRGVPFSKWSINSR